MSLTGVVSSIKWSGYQDSRTTCPTCDRRLVLMDDATLWGRLYALCFASRFSFGFDFAAGNFVSNIVSISKRDGTRAQHYCESAHVINGPVCTNCSFIFPHNFGVHNLPPMSSYRQFKCMGLRIYSAFPRLFFLPFVDSNHATK